MCADCAGADWQMGLGCLEDNWDGFGASQAPTRVVYGLGGEKAGVFARKV